MVTAPQLRDDFVTTITHISTVFGKTQRMSGRHQPLSFPDLHKLSEGLFLSAWSHWEELCRDLLILDLGTGTNNVLTGEVTKFRTKRAAARLAERMLNHPDHPEKFVDWNDYGNVVSRANSFLALGHRYVSPLPAPLGNDLVILKRIRNSIAHKSDKAWASFISLISTAPFNLASRQRRGITPGRFISSHQWNNMTVLEHSLHTLESCSRTLVP